MYDKCKKLISVSDLNIMLYLNIRSYYTSKTNLNGSFISKKTIETKVETENEILKFMGELKKKKEIYCRIFLNEINTPYQQTG